MTPRPDPHFFETEADRAHRENEGVSFFRGLAWALGLSAPLWALAFGIAAFLR